MPGEGRKLGSKNKVSLAMKRAMITDEIVGKAIRYLERAIEQDGVTSQGVTAAIHLIEQKIGKPQAKVDVTTGGKPFIVKYEAPGFVEIKGEVKS